MNLRFTDPKTRSVCFGRIMYSLFVKYWWHSDFMRFKKLWMIFHLVVSLLIFELLVKSWRDGIQKSQKRILNMGWSPEQIFLLDWMPQDLESVTPETWSDLQMWNWSCISNIIISMKNVGCNPSSNPPGYSNYSPHHGPNNYYWVRLSCVLSRSPSAFFQSK